jgi:hypothetical protein
MKRLIIVAMALSLAASVALAAGKVAMVRIYTPNMDDYRMLASDPSLDITGARPGEHIDVIVPHGQLDDIVGKGYAFEYLMYDIHDEANYAGKGYSSYTNYGEMLTRLNSLASNYANITRLTDEGTGRVGSHQVWLMKISDDVTIDDPNEKKLIVTGVHHAREPMSLEVTLYFIEQLCANYATDSDVQDIINGLELYIVPNMNPEGHNFDDVENQRNNFRKNGYDYDDDGTPFEEYSWGYPYGEGVDLNRNYSYEWGNYTPWYYATYCGPEALSEPENQIIADLATNIGFVSGMSFHSYSELILRPWGYTSADPPPEDMAIFDDIGYAYQATILDEMGRNYTYCAGYDLYPTRGDFMDYMYGEHGCYPFTIELNSWSDGGFYPDESYIEPTITGHYEALKEWCLYCLNNLTDVDDEEGGIPNAPTAFTLKPAYPNPASDSATFAFALPKAAEVTLDVYDVKGRKVMNVLEGKRDSGDYEVTADIGSLSSGVYIYRIEAGNDSATRKLIISE